MGGQNLEQPLELKQSPIVELVLLVLRVVLDGLDLKLSFDLLFEFAALPSLRLLVFLNEQLDTLLDIQLALLCLDVEETS